jgi:acetyl esterase/lipase
MNRTDTRLLKTVTLFCYPQQEFAFTPSCRMKAPSFIRSLRLCLAVVQLALLPYLRAADPKLPGDAKVLKDLPYVTNGHAKQKLDLYLPASPKGPLLVCIHGGAWRSGSKNNAEGIPLLAYGYAVANVEYRFSQDAIFPAQIEDCKAAIRWLRAHASEYGYDPKHVGAWGASAGGHLIALLATTGNSHEFDVGENLDQSSAIQCGVDLFGPTNFPDWKPPSANPLIQRSGPDSCLVQLLGGLIEEKMDLARKASPVTWVSKDSAPLFILHGTKDPLVGLEQSQELADKLKAAGAEVILDVVQGGGHGGPPFFADDRPKRLLEFLNRHLADSKVTR